MYKTTKTIILFLSLVNLGNAAEVKIERSREVKPRNIVFVLTDDHRFDVMGFMGHPFIETPNMDRMAKEGINYTNAFVTTSLCSPSRASILTGLYAHNHRVVDNYNPLPENLIYFPQYLQKAGYETAFIGKWHMGGDIDYPQPGFDHWISFKGQGVYAPDKSTLKAKGRYVPQAENNGYNINGKKVPQKKYITDELTDFTLDWLDNRKQKEKPFMLYLSHKAVHADFLPPNRYAFRYDKEPIEKPKTWVDSDEDYVDIPMWVKNQRNSRHGVEYAYYSSLDIDKYYRRYCETLLAVDESLGKIFSWLEENNQLESTLVVYMGDNGFMFGEHGLIDKRAAYEESMRVPLMMLCPDLLKAGKVVDEVVANIDIAPTLLDLAGIKKPAHMDGDSFLPIALGQKDVKWRDYLLYEYYWERNYPQTPTVHAVRGKRYKYIRYHGIWDIDELYDVPNDPKEQNNLINSPEHQDIIKKLNKRLFELLAESKGMNIPMVSDRGTKFNQRKAGGTQHAPFPPYLYKKAD